MIRFLYITITLIFLGSAALPQDAETGDRGYLQGLLEDTLSDAGHQVRIKGFKGALSSKATIDELTIADQTGIWITLTDLLLEWDRGALLSGKLEITQLTAGEILLPRLPQSDAGLSPEQTQATPFSLPELPVSVQIGNISAGRVVLGTPVLGEEVELAINGSMSLAQGDGSASLIVERAQARGQLALETSYTKATEILVLELDLKETAGGIAANLLGLPGRPALDLTVKGNAPLSDFTARLELASDGENRLNGDFRINSAQNANSTTPDRIFSARVAGDITPLLAPEFRPFFGQESLLSLTGRQGENGAFQISDLTLLSDALSVNGQLDLGTDGWPQQFTLNGTLAGKDRVRLPVSGPGTWVDHAGISARFDANNGNEWLADVTFNGFDQGGLSIDQGTLFATGTLRRTAPQRVTARLAINVAGLDHTDKSLAQALGQQLSGNTDLFWQPDTPLEFAGLKLISGDVRLTGKGQIDRFNDGFPVSGTIQIETGTLTRFGPLLGRNLAGSANATIDGGGALLGGAFDVGIRARTLDLQSDIPRLDPLLVGTSNLQLDMRRDTSGTTLDQLAIENDALSLAATGQVDSTRGQFVLSGRLADIAVVEPKMSGPATLDTKLDWAFDGDVNLQDLKLRLVGTTLDANGTLSPQIEGLPATGQITVSVADLSPFSAHAGKNLAGQIALMAEGSGDLAGKDLHLSLQLDGNGLQTGIAQLDQIITGETSLTLIAGRDDRYLDIRKLSLTTGQLTLSAEAVNETTAAPLGITARLANLGLFASDFPGALGARGTIRLVGPDAGEIIIDLNAEGPGGTDARVTGKIIDFGAHTDLAFSGTVPLALANGLISPRSIQGSADYDLRLVGKPEPSALSGTIRTSGAYIALPTIGISVEEVIGDLSLSEGTAQIDLSGRFSDGGSLMFAGPVNLAAPFVGDIAADLSDVVVTDHLIYTTKVDGRVTFAGPLTGGAVIGGALTLDETEIRIPSSTAAQTVELENIRHLNQPENVAATRRRAGLIKPEQGAPPPPYPLDLRINAPTRIFVRGRGLDAELGGQLYLDGTTNNVISSGQLQLIRGRLDILGKRLTLKEGLVDLRGALDPYLRFVAETETEDANIQIIIEGLASALDITFQSQPELPQEEVVSLLLFGRGLQNISPFQAAQLVSAIATLSGRSSNDYVGRLRDTVGLSDLDLTSTEEGTTEVRAGAYLSENIYSEVTVDSEGRQEINLNLDISSGLTVKGALDSDGGTGLGVFFEKDY